MPDQHLDTNLDAPEQADTNEDAASNNFTNPRESNAREKPFFSLFISIHLIKFLPDSTSFLLLHPSRKFYRFSGPASKKPTDEIITEAEEVEPDTLVDENSANCSENEKNEELNLNDPSSSPVIDSQLRTYLIERGPLQGKDADFSLSENLFDKRRFSVDWFKKSLSNGETVERAWIICI